MRIRAKANPVQATLLSDFEDNINHGVCVSNLTYLLAKEMGYDESICYELALAGLVHDIGKLKLSRYLYGRNEDDDHKNDDGTEYMRMHSKLSYDILKKYDFSDLVLDSVLYHHENYDGTGYPRGLKGTEIPLMGRILTIADCFDAMTARRPYKQERSIDYAAGELKKNSGTQFELVPVFLSLIEDGKIAG